MPQRVPLQFTGAAGVRIRGAASGQEYRADPGAPALLVDAVDVPGLLRSGLFRRDA